MFKTYLLALASASQTLCVSLHTPSTHEQQIDLDNIPSHESLQLFRATNAEYFRVPREFHINSSYTTSEPPYGDKILSAVYQHPHTNEFKIKQLTLDEIYDSPVLVYGDFDDAAGETGWGRLSIRTVPKTNLNWEVQSAVYYAAGYLEGYLTCEYIGVFFKNYYDSTFNGIDPSTRLVEFMNKNDKWIRMQVKGKADTDSYWRHVGSVYRQLDGMVDGYNSQCSEKYGKMTDLEFRLLNMNGDLFDLQDALKNEKTAEEEAAKDATNVKATSTSHNSAKEDEVDVDAFKPTHCSAMLLLESDFSEFYIGHDTWDTYSNIYPRIFKHVILPVTTFSSTEASTPSSRTTHTHVHYTSMPGYISSVDDFYAVKGLANLTITETSITAYNKSVLVQDEQTVFSWIRVVVANALSTDGKTWSELFTKYNSGTYNNQWLVVDMEKWHKFSEPEPGFFYLVEQTPMSVVTKDLTEYVTTNMYFASYNIPYDRDVWKAMGYEDAASKSKQPDTFYYEKAPRALLFGSLWGVVENTTDMAFVMGWNDFHEERNTNGHEAHVSVASLLQEKIKSLRFLSVWKKENNQVHTAFNSPANGISARQDLVDGKNKKAYGGIDSKVASYTSLMSYTTPISWVRAGPTTDENPAFCWEEGSALSDETPHFGHPMCYDYDWQLMFNSLYQR
eukprot:CFRG2840T1